MTLEDLTARARREIELTAHPAMDWMRPTAGPDGRPALDVLVVGAGQGGITVGFQLQRERVDNILVIDRAARGREGPWVTYARMPTLRSPKEFTGPDLGVPSLTYRAWHEARFGAASWQALTLIAREAWNDYLLWVREVTGVPVANETELIDLTPAGSLLRARLRDRDGARDVYARKVVLASGQDGAGRWWMPEIVAALPDAYRAHAADEIDFAALKGRTVAVLGAGASAADNAAVALEHGAAEVHMFVRRDKLQRVQPYRWLTFAGFLRHLGDLDDAWRWRFMRHVLGMRESIPQDTYDRMRRWDNFHLHIGAGWNDARVADGRVRIDTAKGPFAADFVIAGTGMDVDFAARPELAAFAGDIRTWADAYTPPAGEADDRLGRFPYLDANGAYMAKVPGRAPWLADIHDFTIAATMSFGPSGASINAMKIAVPRLVAGITRGLFAADVAAHWASLKAYDEPVFVPTGPDADK